MVLVGPSMVSCFNCNKFHRKAHEWEINEAWEHKNTKLRLAQDAHKALGTKGREGTRADEAREARGRGRHEIREAKGHGEQEVRGAREHGGNEVREAQRARGTEPRRTQST